MPPVFDLRLIPIAYGVGHVCGLVVAMLEAVRKGTTLQDEAAERPLYFGLVSALCYTSFLTGRLLSVS